jgi:hypothetical protein
MTMHKHIILAVSIILLAASTASAQWKPAELGLGLKVGAGISDVANSTKPTDTRTAYVVGGMLNYKQNSWVSFQMELLYTLKGYRRKDVIVRDSTGEMVGTTNAEFILGYAEVPVLAKFTPPIKGKYRPYLLGGGFMGISIYDKYRVSNDLVAIDFDLENVEKVDMGATVAVGIDIKAGDGWVSFETRFDSSLLPAIKDQDQKSQVIFFQFGYWW